MIKVLLSDFWHVLLFPKSFKLRGDSKTVQRKLSQAELDFLEKYFLNEEVLSFCAKIKKEYQLKCGIYSSGNMFKAPELQTFLTPVFNHNFSSLEIRFEKDNPDSFKYIAKEFAVLPSEILFIDDSPKNIGAALEAGVRAVLYQNNVQLQSEVQKLLKSQ